MSFPLELPTAVLIASFNPVFLCASLRRSIYFLESLNFKKSFERSFSSMYQQTIYHRVAEFVDFLKLLINQPDAIKTDAFRNEMSKKLINIPEEKEDLQAMAFYCWMKSKMINQKYYDVLLDVVNQQNKYPTLLN